MVETALCALAKAGAVNRTNIAGSKSPYVQFPTALLFCTGCHTMSLRHASGTPHRGSAIDYCDGFHAAAPACPPSTVRFTSITQSVSDKRDGEISTASIAFVGADPKKTRQ